MITRYPIRCQIMDVIGREIFPYIIAETTPDVSCQHVGKFGTAEKWFDGNVRITLDDDSVLWGYECWWQPVLSNTGSTVTAAPVELVAPNVDDGAAAGEPNR